MNSFDPKGRVSTKPGQLHGPDHPDVGQSLNNLAALAMVQHRWTEAADYWRQSTDLLIRRSKRGTEIVGTALTGKRMSEAERSSNEFRYLIKVTSRLAEADKTRMPELVRETFITAQWAQSSEAAASLAKMAARGAKGDPALAVLVRERQDLVEEWQNRDAMRTAAVSQPPEKRERAAEATNLARLTDIDGRIVEIDGRLKIEFADYAARSRPKPLTVAELQAELGADEALVLFLDTPDWQPMPNGTFIWVVTKTDMRWKRSDLGTRALSDRVAVLRCGLDRGEWVGKDRIKRCRELVGAAPILGMLPFHLGVAHELYEALLAPIEDLIAGKRVLVVPSGPLASLPFHVLVTERPEQPLPANLAGYRQAKWLVHGNAITVLPSVASLASLRRDAHASAAGKPFLGIGNPLLVGKGEKPDKRAWLVQTCANIVAPIPVHVAQAPDASVAPGLRGKLTNVADVRKLNPLPDTTQEVCNIARVLGLPESRILLGETATETEIKAMGKRDELKDYKVVLFATHGLVPERDAGRRARTGEIEGLAEPALALTPPQDGTTPEEREVDDGLLTASEIAQLRFDADWIVLSACNTASGNELGTEALSGLARAFFYAGARTLLVSHWKVFSGPAVQITSGTFDTLRSHPNVGKAEALRRSMVALMLDTSQAFAHPDAWAPFVVVGEGTR